MIDVLVAGAGPAGSVAALLLARAGARVLLVDREVFPREKLCGDTVNPGAIDLLGSLQLAGGPVAQGAPLTGMMLTGARASVRAEYGGGRVGRSVPRAAFDQWLLERALAAGARFESAVVVKQPLTHGEWRGPAVRGVWLAPRERPDAVRRIPAAMVIAADGVRSTLGRSLGLVAPAPSPRRWAFGVYARGVAGLSTCGEMHVRGSYYTGVAPMPGGLANICVVTGPRPPGGRDPLAVIRAAIDADEALSDRFANAEFLGRPRVLGPLASEARACGVDGLLLAGDAAGFVDPMTGDGLHLAMKGAVLAAREALRSLEMSDTAGAPRRLSAERARVLGAKLRFNRAIRLATCSPATVGVLNWSAALLPALMRPVIRYAGDVNHGARYSRLGTR